MKRNLLAHSLILPAVLFIAVFAYYPSFSAVYYSFTDWNGFNDASFVGLDNYKSILTDKEAARSFANIGIFTLLNLLVFPVVSLLAAELIFHVKHPKWRQFYQVSFVAPLMVPQVIVIYVWNEILAQNGLVNQVLGIFTENTPNWLGDPSLALLSIWLFGFPFAHGIFILMLLAGLQSIPKSIMEAVKLEGISWWSRFWRIDLPMIRPQLTMTLILLFIWTLQSLSVQVALTKGGPLYSTTVPGYVMYVKALGAGQFGISNAIGIVLFIIILILTLLTLKLKKPVQGGV